jgi:hypothetical protein
VKVHITLNTAQLVIFNQGVNGEFKVNEEKNLHHIKGFFMAELNEITKKYILVSQSCLVLPQMAYCSVLPPPSEHFTLKMEAAWQHPTWCQNPDNSDMNCRVL